MCKTVIGAGISMFNNNNMERLYKHAFGLAPAGPYLLHVGTRAERATCMRLIFCKPDEVLIKQA
jgi:hypothetical protein